MFTWVAKKVFGTANDRALRRVRARVDAINGLEKKIQSLSDAELQAKTPEFKEKLDNGASLDDILSEAFAVCREASMRTLKMRHYDVQLVGGMILHGGSIAEMKTGEGKTLMATLPIYLNALEGKGVHLVTVNDYLATRDAEWMGNIYNFLGLSYGCIVNQQDDAEKRAAYKADICYGQNNEFGFDYLRDNMKFSALDYAQRPLNYAIVDEVDSILIDEARTPLIISGANEASSDKYAAINELMPRLRLDEHYVLDEKGWTVTLTDDGVELAERLLECGNLYETQNLETLHILNQLLKAHTLYKRDQHYMVSPDGKVMIIDEFTGRVLAGRRWSDGLHQAVEAKENVPIQEESRTLATITFQNLFRIYKKLAGMTGTALTEAAEFHATYKLDSVAVPPNKPIIRDDVEDIVYKTEREKFTAVIKEIMERNETGQPVLVGTTSVEKSGAIARILKKKKIDHNVLNAKHHENEAYVVAQAGRKGAITVSTNMAGRGTDIVLGGNPEMIAKMNFKNDGRLPEAEPEEFEKAVKKQQKASKKEQAEVLEAGGLHIVGTERHESRRIDNQLRGRAGRQGDPGSSRFYLSLEDDLMRIFAGDRVKTLMDRMGMPDDEPIEHPWVTKSVENAQRKVEERNFDQRKNVLEYDDVMNAQRKTVYSLRQQLLAGRYEPEETDELGKPTGRVREIPVDPAVTEVAAPLVGKLFNMFAEEPVQAVDEDGNPREPVHDDVVKIGKLVETDALQYEIYQHWGVKLDIETRTQSKKKPVELYDETVELVSAGLTEQRERLLDLVDRVVSAMVEESCPRNRQAEDWDWKAVHTGFKEHFGLPIDNDIDDLGDVEQLVRVVYERAEEIALAKEEELGIDLLARIFRHQYLEEIDKSWMEHLTNMEHLRDGIGLRGYGQKDPKNEYKKEGYNLFVNMMARVSSEVLVRLFEAEMASEGDIEALEAEDDALHRAQLEAAVAAHLGEIGDDDDDVVEVQPQAPAPKVTGDDPCPCGSGEKFRECHGEALFDDDDGAAAE